MVGEAGEGGGERRGDAFEEVAGEVEGLDVHAVERAADFAEGGEEEVAFVRHFVAGDLDGADAGDEPVVAEGFEQEEEPAAGFDDAAGLEAQREHVIGEVVEGGLAEDEVDRGLAEKGEVLGIAAVVFQVRNVSPGMGLADGGAGFRVAVHGHDATSGEFFRHTNGQIPASAGQFDGGFACEIHAAEFRVGAAEERKIGDRIVAAGLFESGNGGLWRGRGEVACDRDGLPVLADVIEDQRHGAVMFRCLSGVKRGGASNFELWMVDFG